MTTVSPPPAALIKGRPGATAVTGMVLMIGAMILVPVMDAIAKLLATSYAVSPGQITFFRFFVQAVLIFSVLVLFRPAPSLMPRHWLPNFARGALHALASLAFFTALKYMPLADSMAIFFVAPLLLVLASAWILKETVGVRRQLSVFVGFLGAILVIRPNFIELGWPALLPVLAAVLFTSYLLLTKRWAERDHPVSMQLASGIGGALVLVMALTLGHFARMPELVVGLPDDNIAWLLMILIGGIAAVGHLLLTFAFRYTAASILAPFQYLEIVVATSLGYLMFGDFPDFWKWVGIFIIVISGLYVFWRERRAARQSG